MTHIQWFLLPLRAAQTTEVTCVGLVDKMFGWISLRNVELRILGFLPMCDKITRGQLKHQVCCKRCGGVGATLACQPKCQDILMLDYLRLWQIYWKFTDIFSYPSFLECAIGTIALSRLEWGRADKVGCRIGMIMYDRLICRLPTFLSSTRLVTKWQASDRAMAQGEILFFMASSKSRLALLKRLFKKRGYKKVE